MAKIALVIGASGGIGFEVTKILTDNGVKICATYNTNKNKLEELQKSDKNVSVYQMDIKDETSVKNTMQQIIKDKTRIDIVVFSATSKIKNKNVLSLEWNDFKEHIDLQVKGLLLVVHSLREQIEKKHKTKFIILLTEYCIGKPPAGISHYVAAKYCLMGIAKSMAVELAKYNCTVNMVSPGMVETGLISYLPPKLVEMTAESNPLKRIAMPKDVANVVLFLASDDSDYLNGVNILVNGGGAML